MTDLNALADELEKVGKGYIQMVQHSECETIVSALRAAASSQAGVLAMRKKAEPVLSFLDELAANAAPGKREPLNSILIGGSAKLYAEGFRAAIDNIDVQAGVETATPPSQEPVAWQWYYAGDWHTITRAEVSDPESYARGLSNTVRAIYTHPTPAPSGNAEALRTALVGLNNHLDRYWEGDRGTTRTIEICNWQQKCRAALSTPAPAPAQPDPQQFETFAKMVRDAIQVHSSPIESGCRVDEIAFSYIASTIWRAITPAQQAVDVEVAQRDRDIGILLSNLRYLEEATGETLEGQDAEIVRHIERDHKNRASVINGGRDAG